jgi:hypothetical protein
MGRRDTKYLTVYKSKASLRLSDVPKNLLQVTQRKLLEKLKRSEERKSIREEKEKGSYRDGFGNDRNGRKGTSRMSRPAHGYVVGQGASPLGEGNVGHAILRGLGWSPGETIGAVHQKGIQEPILAVVRAKQRGLGS